LVPAVGRRWQGQGTAFAGKESQLTCTLLGCWGEDHTDPWLVVTDLLPQAADVCWYGMRAWIEQSFKRLKSGGWQWQSTRMTDPERAERLWLAMAVATWWLLSVGGESEANVRIETLPQLPGSARRGSSRWRVTGIFRQGWCRILAALLRHDPLPMGHGCPEPWPTMPAVEPAEPMPEQVNEKTLQL
jgi:hypothetical protein